MGRLFGTDGVRGLANGEITASLALELAAAAARVLPPASATRPVAIVGRDTRISGDFLAAAVSAGLAGAGVDVIDVGVLPTPAVAYLTRARGAALGVMISASHNPMPDNGIKFFAAGGEKLDDATEDAIERALGDQTGLPTGANVGRITRDDAAGGEYVDHVRAATATSLEGLTVVVDCAHGAASTVGPQTLQRAGAQVHTLGCDPDGTNINDGCGSTHLDALQRAVVAQQADAGLAYDGDADRFLAVDAAGVVVDGDQIMGVLARALQSRGELVDNTLVATVMSNQGLQLAMDEAGISLVRTKVGDRYVLEELARGGYSLGGEQSGHVVLPEFASTGDGVLTSLLICAEMASQRRTLAELAGTVKRLPQKLINVRDVDKTRADSDASVQAAVERAEAELGDTGRVLLRPSGTEPVVRVMVEAATADEAERVCADLAAVVSAELAL